jgi:transcriptional regulator with GAF, ATPase, and Fis domain
VGDLSPTAQSKILRAVETGEFERLGSETLQRGDVCLISATNIRSALRTAGTAFATTSFYRISGITLAVPSLRERPNDLPTLLANEIARASRRQGTSIVGLDREAGDRLLAYRWPGNLRELSKIVAGRRGADDGEVIKVDHLLLPDDPPPRGRRPARAGAKRTAR